MDIRRNHELVLCILEERGALYRDVSLIAIKACHNLTVCAVGLSCSDLHQQGVLTVKHDLVVVERRDNDLRFTDL